MKREAPVFARERPEEIWEQALPLARAHQEALDPQRGQIAPNLEGYVTLERAGCLRIYTARLAGELKGFLVFFLQPSLRRFDEMQALQDMLVLEEGQGPWLTAALLRYAERALRAEGVKIIYHSCPAGARLGALLELMGYRATFVVHTKELTEG